MMTTTDMFYRKPGYYGRPEFERQLWPLFGEAKFPNYENFWQTFVPPRTNPKTPYIKFLSEVSRYERRIIQLNYRTLRVFGRVYDDKSYTGRHTEAAWYKERTFIAALDRLNLICSNVDWLLFLCLLKSGKLDEQHSVFVDFQQRVKEHKAKVIAANAPYKGRKLSLDDFPPHVPGLTLSPGDLQATKDHYDLSGYHRVEKQLRSYQKRISLLKLYDLAGQFVMFDAPIGSKTDEPHQREEYRQAAYLADQPAIKKIIGDYPTMPDLVQAQADQLIAALNSIWGEQLVPMFSRESSKTPQTALQNIQK
jgi:hypothetical protein